MLEVPDKNKLRSENEIELFLRLFPLLAAHFELKEDVSGGLAGFLRDAAKVLAKEYEEALDNELQSDKNFVARLPSVLPRPKIKKPILEDE